MRLDGSISYSKLAIHARCFDELRKVDDSARNIRNRRNESISNGIIMTLLDQQKLCCHHNLKDLQVHTDGKWGD